MITVYPQLNYKIQFSSLKTYRSASCCICEMRQMLSFDLMISYCQENYDFKFFYNMQIYQVFKMHATLGNSHFLCSSSFFDNLKFLLVSFLQHVKLLCLCDVTDTISHKYLPHTSLMHALTVLHFLSLPSPLSLSLSLSLSLWFSLLTIKLFVLTYFLFLPQ